MIEAASSAVDAARSARPTQRRVLWVLKGLGLGGAERLAVTCARAFDRARWNVDVAYVLPHKDAMVDDLLDAGIVVHCVGDAGQRIGWTLALMRLVRSGGYDLVHTHSPVPAVAVRAMPRSQRPTVVHTEHNLWSRYQPVTRVANALTFRQNAGALAVSHGVAASIGQGSHPPATVLHHGIDLSQAAYGATARASARRRLGLPDQVPVIGTVANFTPKKDQASLILAVADIVRVVPDLRVILVGSGPLEHALRDQVRALGLTRTVVFAGSRNDVSEVLPAFDLFVLSSRYEGLSIALVEAMASGVPAVATAVGGVPEVITNEVDGLLVPAGRPDVLAATVARLLGDIELRGRLAVAARRRAADFDIARAVRFMERWYEEILG